MFGIYKRGLVGRVQQDHRDPARVSSIFSLALTPHSPPGSHAARWQTRTAARLPSPAG